MARHHGQGTARRRPAHANPRRRQLGIGAVCAALVLGGLGAISATSQSQAAATTSRTATTKQLADLKAPCGPLTIVLGLSGNGRYAVLEGSRIEDGCYVLRDLSTNLDMPFSTDLASGKFYPENGWSYFVANDGKQVIYPSGTQIVSANLTSHAVTVVSAAADGTAGNSPSTAGVVSANGDWLAFSSTASNLVPSAPTGDSSNLFRKNLRTGAIEIAVPTNGAPDSELTPGGISDNGQRLAFISNASNIVGATVQDGQIVTSYIRDFKTGEVAPLLYTDVPADGARSGDSPQISADGLVAAYLLRSPTNSDTGVVKCGLSTSGPIAPMCSKVAGPSNVFDLHLATGGSALEYSMADASTNNVWQVFRADLTTGGIDMTSVNTNGLQANANVGNLGGAQGISGDGLNVFFSTDATNMYEGAPDNQTHGYLRTYAPSSVVTPTPTPTSAPAGLTIAALGDSVASGEGTRYRWHYVLDATKDNGKNGVWNGKWVSDNINPTWEPTNDNTPSVQDCHRSTDGYPYKVASALNASLLDLACSGASAGNGILRRQVFSDGNQAAKPQLGIAESLYDPPNTDIDNFKPDVITLTLGANDVDFSGIVTACYKSAGEAWKHPRSKYCDTDPSLRVRVNTLLSQQRSDLTKTLTELTNRTKFYAKQPPIIITTYYDPFPNSYAKCADILPGIGVFGLSPGEMAWLKTELISLNDNIRSVARRFPQVKVVNLENLMNQHQWCTRDPWAYGPSIVLQSGQGANPSPFHPTPYAQTLIAGKVAAAIRSAVQN